ncbi:hypothetical protein LMG28688_05841 [Paraburkholderia caffeinitolerans]|uniref:Uncharacterized protein n=2 Tax=Paraburkholderia caffeinitolerans TaxID=1723730 RepID=A0A6J5GPX3_9BURK|nr:hypothetical protein LMG28688_05841 [Paraburkholderia caffeinitolerans]
MFPTSLPRIGHIPRPATRAVTGAVRMGLVALMPLASACVAQTPPGPAAPDLPPAAAGPSELPVPGALPVAPAPPRTWLPSAIQTSPVAQGTVSRFVINPEGDVDGFILGDGSLVHFPPHLGTQLVAAVQPGDAVQVAGFRDGSGDVKAQQIVNQRTGQQLVDQPPPPDVPRPPPALRGAGLVRLSVQGEVLRVTTAPRGEPDGVLLRDGTVVKLTPIVAQQFANLLRPGATVAATGYGTRNRYGEALQATAFGTPGNLTRLYTTFPN